MPALQVRDMPDELYNQLKTLAGLQHRSMAQQTIVAVEDMVNGNRGDAELPPYAQDTTGAFSGSPLAAAKRKQRRAAVLDDIHKSASSGIVPPIVSLNPVEAVREGREEREAEQDEALNGLRQEGII